MSKKIITQAQAKAKKIKLMIFDVDGVMTDGRLYYSAYGEEIKVFNVHDGFGIKALQKIGIKTAVISGRKSPALDVRLKDLSIDYVYTGVGENKALALSELLTLTSFSVDVCGVMGDDIPDLELINVCGFSAAPLNAVAEILNKVNWVSTKNGGSGAVREVCEFIINCQNIK